MWKAFYLRYCLPRKIELNLQYAQRASVLQDIWIIIQTLCPYWLGVLIIYVIDAGGQLLARLRIALRLCTTRQDFEEFRRYLPWIVFPQLILLFWGGQLRGMISYFSIPEMRRTTTALGIACLFQFGLSRFSQGRLEPAISLLLIDCFFRSVALCGGAPDLPVAARTFLRFKTGKPVGSTAGGHHWHGQTGNQSGPGFRQQQNRPPAGGRFLRRQSAHLAPTAVRHPVIGMPECLLNAEWRSKIDEVIVALPEAGPARLQNNPRNAESVACQSHRSLLAWPTLKPGKSESIRTNPVTYEKIPPGLVAVRSACCCCSSCITRSSSPPAYGWLTICASISW